MAGVYVHIPFCASRCSYCDFFSTLQLEQAGADYVEAVIAEALLRREELHGETVRTLYLGGGTPSQLPLPLLSRLVAGLGECSDLSGVEEFTVEANPDDVTAAWCEALPPLGVNRVSMGVQTFEDDILRLIGRRHTASQVEEAVARLRDAGIDNISIDLIYGLPTSDAEQWNKNLNLFFALELPHLSAYALTLEPNAILTKQIEQGKVCPVNEEDALRDYETLCKRAAEKGYLHYEISNFCKSGRHSKHNASYWFGTPYLGFGPSAHSYDGASRQWNVSSVERYCEVFSASSRHCEERSNPETKAPSLDCFVVPPRNDAKRVQDAVSEIERLTPEQLYDEYVMLRLRTHWGIDLKWLKREMGERFSSYCEQHAQPLIAQGRLSQTREFLYLTDKQMLFADGVAEELFWE